MKVPTAIVYLWYLLLMTQLSFLFSFHGQMKENQFQTGSYGSYYSGSSR